MDIVKEFVSAPFSKKIFILHFYDVPKDLVYQFFQDVCERKDYLFAMSILTNGRSAHHFVEIDDLEFFEKMKEHVKDHRILTHMIDDLVSNRQPPRTEP